MACREPQGSHPNSKRHPPSALQELSHLPPNVPFSSCPNNSAPLLTCCFSLTRQTPLEPADRASVPPSTGGHPQLPRPGRGSLPCRPGPDWGCGGGRRTPFYHRQPLSLPRHLLACKPPLALASGIRAVSYWSWCPQPLARDQSSGDWLRGSPSSLGDNELPFPSAL